MTRPVAPRFAAALAPLFPDGFPVGLHCWDGSRAGPDTTPAVVLRSPAALRHLLRAPGELGVARAYVSGELDIEGDITDTLRRVHAAFASNPARPTALLRVAPRTIAALAAAGGVGRRPNIPAAEARLTGKAHSRGRDAAVIAHHYDLSNALYALLLDEHMAYSCGYWTSDDASYTVADAQRDKLDLICTKLEVHAGSRLLDIGCGWGALAVHAAAEYGAHVTGITLSAQQLAYAADRVEAAGVDDRVQLLRMDYRDLPNTNMGAYDAISAIEMGEHVGADNYPQFLSIVHRMLASTGRLLIQQMSRRRHPGGGPFIESYIAPDMHMRPLAETIGLVEDAGFEVRDVQAMREHYTRTIRAWLHTFETRYDDVVALVGTEQARVWRLYLVGGALAFEDNRMGVDQILASRAHAVASRDGEPRRPAADGRRIATVG